MDIVLATKQRVQIQVRDLKAAFHVAVEQEKNYAIRYIYILQLLYLLVAFVYFVVLSRGAKSFIDYIYILVYIYRYIYIHIYVYIYYFSICELSYKAILWTSKIRPSELIVSKNPTQIMSYVNCFNAILCRM